jgi:PAS domain S-box-containing protein
MVLLMQRIVATALLALLLLTSVCVNAAERQKILVLASYHAGLSWTDGQIAGLREGLSKAENPPELFIEYLDTKRTPPTPAYWAKLSNLFNEKYHQTKIALVVAQDDDALDFALQQRLPGRLLNGIPIVFSGVAGSRLNALSKEPWLTGVFDDADISNNIQLLLNIKPTLKRIVFVHDQSRTGLAQASGVEQLANKYPQLSFDFLTNLPAKGIQVHLSALDKNSAVILLTFNRDADNQLFSHEEASRLWAEASPVPVIAKEDGMLAPGVLGGIVVSSRLQGTHAADAAQRILSGTDPNSMPMHGGETEAIFDYAQLQRFGISADSLPTEAEIKNRPHSMRETHPREFWLSVALITCLSLIILLLIIHRLRQKRTQAALKASEERYRLLLRFSPVGIVHFDNDLNLTYSNDRFAEIVNAPRGKLNNINFRQLKDQSPVPACMDAIAGKSGYYEGSYTSTLSNSQTSVSFRTAPIHGASGEIMGGIGIIEDVSARIAAEAEIRQLNTDLEKRVTERTAELVKANADIQTAMKKLAQSERLASLGSLVAGVAHELNTPLGNARTVASTLHERIKEFNFSIANGQLKRSVLERFVTDSNEATAMIERNLERSAELVRSFKEIAVDQTSIRRRKFDLAQTIDELLNTLRPTLRRTPHTVSVDIPSDIILDSFPGPLDQIIANLINNSLIHAFSEDDAGEIQITGRQEDEMAVIEYRDNGAGMSESVASRAFDPFFTTRLGTGGSGLGLYITRNLTHDILNGTLNFETAPNQGVHYIFRFPLVAPAETTPATL